MKAIFTFFFFTLFSHILISQSENLSWIKTIIDDEPIEFSNLHVLENEEVIITGQFNNYFGVDLDPSDEEFLTNSTTGHREVFIQKYDKQGDLIWTSPILGKGHKSITTIKSNTQNEIFILGDFDRSTDFDPEEDREFKVDNIEGSDLFSKDIFLLKLDENGKLIWVKTFGGTSNDLAGDFEFDHSGDIIITGVFSSTVQFDNTGNNNGLVESRSGQDIFILKLNEFGNFIWVKTCGGNEDLERSSSIVVDQNNNIYVSGIYGSCVDFNPSLTEVDLSCSYGRFDAFVLSLDMHGYYKWTYTYGNVSWDTPPKLLIHENNIYLAGAAKGELELTSNGSPFQKVGSPHYWSGLFIKMNLEGVLYWATTTKSVGNSTQCRISSIDINDNGIIYAAGKFFGPLIFGGQGTVHINNNIPPQVALPNTTDYFDIFYCSIDTDNGEFLSGNSFISQGHDQANDICVTNGVVYMVGQFSNRIDFDPSSSIKIVDGNGGFLLKLEKNEFSYNERICGVNLMPIPAKDKVYIQLDEVYASVNGLIISASGQKVGLFNFKQTNQIELDISNFSAGMYYIQLYDDLGVSICEHKYLKLLKIN